MLPTFERPPREAMKKRLSKCLKVRSSPTKRGKIGVDKGLTFKFVPIPPTIVGYLVTSTIKPFVE